MIRNIQYLPLNTHYCPACYIRLGWRFYQLAKTDGWTNRCLTEVWTPLEWTKGGHLKVQCNLLEPQLLVFLISGYILNLNQLYLWPPS